VAEPREWVKGGDGPELPIATYVDYVDIESGRWAMFSRSTDLANLVAEATCA